MSLDVLEAAFVGAAHSRLHGAAGRPANTEDLKFDLMLKVLQRDDPLRRSYLQRRWRGHPPSVASLLKLGRCNLERTPYSPIALGPR